MNVVLAALVALATAVCNDALDHTLAEGPPIAARESIPVQIAAQGAVLTGEVLLPTQAARGTIPGVVMVHSAGRFERGVYRRGAERLTEMGLAVLLYDKRGIGQSTGRYRDVTPDNSPEVLVELADDARRAVMTLAAQRQVDPARVGLFGGSQAGWILPLAADSNPAVRFLIVLSGPAVSVGLEIRHGRLTDEGKRAIDDEQLSRQLSAFKGTHGFDPLETLRRLQTPTLWIMGDAIGTCRSARRSRFWSRCPRRQPAH
jgi:alpha-beta hydrolase superfamily lysophospholipase